MTFSPTSLSISTSDFVDFAPLKPVLPPGIRLVDSAGSLHSKVSDRERPSTPLSISSLSMSSLPMSSFSRESLTPTPTRMQMQMHTPLHKSASTGNAGEAGKRLKSVWGSRDRDRDKGRESPKTPPSPMRKRGMTVPMVGGESRTQTPEEMERPGSATPSVSGRHIGSWLSGFLGR